jgi:hypothetical protein
MPGLTIAFPEIPLQRITRLASALEHIVAGLMTGKNRTGSGRQDSTVTHLTPETSNH